MEATATTTNATNATVAVKGLSQRQQAITLLAGLPAGTPRKDAVETLKTKLSMGDAYAKTVYQQWRENEKASGNLRTTYHVREGSAGLSIATTHVNDVKEGDFTNPDDAINAYVATLKGRIEAAKTLLSKKK